MSLDDAPDRLPEFRTPVSRTYWLHDSADRPIYVTPLPEAIVAYLGDIDVRTHIPGDLEAVGGGWHVFKDLFNAWYLSLRVRLFEDSDGTRVIAFHQEPGEALGDVSDELAYEWNIDADHPSRSGWRPIRQEPPIDAWVPGLGKLTAALEEVEGLVTTARLYDVRAVAAAAEEVHWDTATEIEHTLMPWLHTLADAINGRFSREYEAAEEEP